MFRGEIDEADKAINDPKVPSNVKSVLLSIKRAYGIGYSVGDLNENTIIKDSIQPFLESYFPNCKRYTTYGADKEIAESKSRFTEMDPSLMEQVKKADFSVISNHSGHLVFALESKSERTKSKSKGDLTKMARYLKDTLDNIEADGFEEIAIAGMITSGVMCSVPLDHYDMHRILPIFSIITQLENILMDSMFEITSMKDEGSHPNTLKELKTYHTLIRTKETKTKKVNLANVAIQRAVKKFRFD